MSRLRAVALAVALPLGAGAAAFTAFTDGGVAAASVMVAVSYEDLLTRSTAAVVATGVEQHALWENGRIYTYTRMLVERAVAGDLPTGSEAWVRTLGGAVGQIGQVVEGEAVMTVGRPTLLFLHAGPAGVHEVTARSQGQFPVVLDKGARVQRVVRSGVMGVVLPPKAVRPVGPLAPASLTPPPLAADVIHDRPLDDVAADIASSWARLHPTP